MQHMGRESLSNSDDGSIRVLSLLYSILHYRMDPMVSIALGGNSSYMHCLNNPLMAVDPRGQDNLDTRIPGQNAPARGISCDCRVVGGGQMEPFVNVAIYDGTLGTVGVLVSAEVLGAYSISALMDLYGASHSTVAAIPAGGRTVILVGEGVHLIAVVGMEWSMNHPSAVSQVEAAIAHYFEYSDVYNGVAERLMEEIQRASDQDSGSACPPPNEWEWLSIPNPAN